MNFIVKSAEVVQNFPYLPFTITAKPSGLTFLPWIRKRTVQHLPGKSHGPRSLVGCSPWGCKESDRTERLHFHFSLSCIGEGNGNPLQCSCLENPRDGGSWWAAIYGVAQSLTRLKRLSSSSIPTLCSKLPLGFEFGLWRGPKYFLCC